MFILYAPLIGLAIGLLLGGRLARLGAIRFRWLPVVLLAIAVQGPLFGPLRDFLPAGDALPRSASGAAQHRAAAGTSGGSRATQRLLRLRGFSEAEASNLTAYLAGLRPAGPGWTLRELDRLLFIRWLVDARRLES